MASLKPGHNIKELHQLIVTVGRHKRNSSDEHSVTFSREEGIFSVAIHEEYNKATVENDIALITLNRKVSFNEYVRPICLLQEVNMGFSFSSLFEGKAVFIAG